MNSKISTSLLASLLILTFTLNSFAHDTDLYTTAGQGVQPNLLIIIDNSGSMLSLTPTGWATPYDPNGTYTPNPAPNPAINDLYVYEATNGDFFNPRKTFKTKVADVPCSSARTRLSTKGIYYGKTNSDCSKDNKLLATGKWLKYYLAFDSNAYELQRIQIAKNVITDILEILTGINVGIMIHNPSEFGGKVISYIKPIDEGSNRQNLIDTVNNIQNWSGTPLGKALYEAGLYFEGKKSYFNAPLDYGPLNPIKYSCQRNFVIQITDGMPDDERDHLQALVGDKDGDGKEPGDGEDYLDDVAKDLYDRDLSPFEGKQNITTYTIDFLTGSSTAHNLMERTAVHGHGKAYMTTNAVNLTVALMSIVNEIYSKTTSFVAPIVPVSRFERTTAGDKIYLAFFRPNQGTMWSGNIKKYSVAQTRDTTKGIEVGDILDIYGSKALDSRGEFYPSSKSYWTTSSNDGGEVERGGVGEILKNRNFSTDPRKIFTYMGTNPDLTHSSNAFTEANSSITTTLLDVPDSDYRSRLIKFIHGIDSWDDNLNGDYDDKRDWFLGSSLHSRPYLIHYGNRTVIYAGANDGMLHAFDDETGKELWGFIPQNFLNRLKEFRTTTPGIFVDGSPKAYVTYDSSGNATKAILIFGLRRGGNYYYALDVTNPDAPKYLYRIEKGTYFKELGQTWSTPVIGKVAYGTGEKWVAIFAGGYDENEDLSSPGADSIGRGIYMADVLTGSAVWWSSYQSGNTAMTYCLPSDITPLDVDGDGRIDRLYVGDTNASLWRFDVGDLNKNGNSDPNEWTGKIIFQSNLGTSEKRKMFYPPDVTLEKDSVGEYEMVFFGTGDREDPKNTESSKVNRIYAVKDRNLSTILKESDLVNVTTFYQMTPEEQASTLSNIKAKYGWFIVLERKAGEKCLATPVVYYKTAYYTTFAPTAGSETDPCFVGEGEARLYALMYNTGEAAFNFDLTNDSGGAVIGGSDRSLRIGTAIPSGVVVTVIGGKVTAYVGVGGGVHRPTLASTRSLFPINWKLVF